MTPFSRRSAALQAAPFVLSLLAACAPPPKVAGHSQSAAPPAPKESAPTAPPPPSTPPAEPNSLVRSPGPTSPTQPSAASPPPAASSERQLGLPGGIALEAVSSSGHFVAYCQPVGTSARVPRDMPLDERDSPTGPVTLTLDLAGEQHEVDEVLAVDPKGRFLVTLEDGAPILRDAGLRKSFSLASLGIDLARDALPDHRSVAFSADGAELALLTQVAGAEPALRILDLSAPAPTAAGRTVPLAGLRVWRVSAEGETFVLASVPDGAKGPIWPVRPWREPNLRCSSGTFDAFARVSGPLRDPALSYSLIARGQTSAQPAPGFVMAFHSGWVRRDDDGRLLVVEGKQQRQLASARCGGRIVGADPIAGWFLVSCEEYRPVKQAEPRRSSNKRSPPPKTRFPLYLLKPGVVRDLDVELMRFGVDVIPLAGQRFTAVRVEAGLLLVDFSKGKAELLQPADRVLLTTKTDVLLASGGRLVRWVDGVRQELGAIGALDPVVQGTQALAVSSTMYVHRMDTGVGGSWEARSLPGAPLVLTGGFALVPAERATATRWARGPVEIIIRHDAAERVPEEEAKGGEIVAGK